MKYFLLALVLVVTSSFIYYPIDGYYYTGIDRLYQLHKMQVDSVKNRRIPIGAYKNMEDIQLNLLDKNNVSISEILTEDPILGQAIKNLIPSAGYSLAVLDMTRIDDLKYASVKEDVGYQPGSVGKIMVLNALMNEFYKICPDSWEDRADYLRGIEVSGRYWATGDHHTIPLYDISKDRLTKRKVNASDTFSLYEWMDHMVSVSNNGAASVVFREAILMAAFGEQYFFITEKEAETYFENTHRDTLTNLAHRVVNQPLREMGITEDEWRLGGMFTRPAGKYVGRKGGSLGSPRGLMKYFVKLEQGAIIDARTSLEIKRLLYLTDRRIRYASASKLDEAAVYFKSGSYYKCDRTKNPDCKAYAGNVFNFMNSAIIVEHPNGIKYMVCLMTNVLNKNSAGAHMYLANKIDDIINKDAPLSNAIEADFENARDLEEPVDLEGN